MDDRIRTSDADRERVTARLRDHYAEGRLSRDELDDRISAALNAKTFGELRRVLADLPEPGPLAPPRGPVATAPRSHPVLRRGPRLFPLLAFTLLAVVLISGGGAAAIALKVVLSVVVVMLIFMAIAALTAAAFIRRVHRHWYSGHFDRYAGNWQAWNWPHGYRHQARCWRS
jgi:hypothetical protein